MMLETLLESLANKNVAKITPDEATQLENKYTLEHEYSTGIAGPIKVLNLEKNENFLILEVDQKGNNYTRLLPKENLQEFVDERLSIYDKMWDGCGCKVFYNELWVPKQEKVTNL